MQPELLADRYELVSTVGKGATGQVWRAIDTLLERMVAIKVVEIEGARDPAMGQRFRREGVAIAGLSNDAIVKVYDTGSDDTRGWLVMELLSGPNFNTLVKDRGPLDYHTGMPLLAAVADGLQAAHDAGITHRDVKPANIVLDAAPDADGTMVDLFSEPSKGRPVLVDFGIAHLVDKAASQLTRPATAIGTAAYMSPEQARGQRVTSASDVYSLACVAYFLFLGRPPFLADTSLAVAHAQAFDTPTPLIELSPDAPPALDALLARMLAKDPKKRPTASEVADELRAISVDPTRDSGLPALPPEAPAGVAPVNGENGFRNAGRWLVALLVLGLMAALAYSWLNTREPVTTPGPTVTVTTTATHTTEAPAPEPEPSESSLMNPVTQPPPQTSRPPVPTTATSEPPSPEPTPTVVEPTVTDTTATTQPIGQATPTAVVDTPSAPIPTTTPTG